MKIAVPSEHQTLNAEVCPSFGRAPFYVIYDSENKTTDYLQNTAAGSQGGAGVQAAQFIVDQQVEAIITPRCGKNAAAVVQEAGIKLYRSISGSIENNLKAFEEQRLSLLEEIHAGFHRHGGR
ncbi:NifB/NifX family molybdenum-iron cluster-binding protein [Tindallia californiensis]|uniref:Predicted Fe-Mo cluster-binding protein, NifX family n=1 Tax=Tindallia californiensis TaxID=159292 RepID=A0A1H3MG06_9FIRM|nr:NifB/NifX family molybdenum-iron cluster-binding protein [Tindallia californiensis]SDY75099.1 Predicted Fe-Mo cluster-binding protein, NifX family [Tindallia californiensis]